METIESINPATGELIEELPAADDKAVGEAVKLARTGFQEWRELSFSQRAAFLAAAAGHLFDDLESIAAIITAEMGKPIKDSRAEVQTSANFVKFLSEHLEEFIARDEIHVNKNIFPHKEAWVQHEPVGVVAAIKPWNLPLQTPMFTVGRALAAGNSVILKPSEYSSLAALEMEKAFQKAGLPAGVMQVLVGGKDTGMELVKADVDMVSFTGSVAAGRDIARVCGDKLIKASLELGGKDPLIIWNDVDLDFAARGTVYGAFTNCGQFCSSVERVYVHEDIYSEMTQKIVAVVKKLTLGFGSDENTDIGPLATKDQLMIVQNHVKDAVAGGAKLLCGGKVPSDSKLGNGFFFEPTVLTGVSHEMQIMTEETFGPVCPIMPFRDEDEAITLANDSNYGLAAAVFAQDEELVDRMASRLDAGMVWINESHITMPGSPWIARKDSGMGMKLGKMGLLEYTQPKLINKQISNNSECRPWWFQLD